MRTTVLYIEDEWLFYLNFAKLWSGRVKDRVFVAWTAKLPFLFHLSHLSLWKIFSLVNWKTPPPWQRFLKIIRRYNSAFKMTSFGAKEQNFGQKRAKYCIATSVIHVIYKSCEARTTLQKVARSAKLFLKRKRSRRKPLFLHTKWRFYQLPDGRRPGGDEGLGSRLGLLPR